MARQVIGGFSPSAILKEIPSSSNIFVGIYCTKNHATTSFSTQNGSKAVDIADSSNSRWDVFHRLKNDNGDCLIVCLTSLSELKRIRVQFA